MVTQKRKNERIFRRKEMAMSTKQIVENGSGWLRKERNKSELNNLYNHITKIGKQFVYHLKTSKIV